MTNGLNWSFSSEDEIFGDVAVLKHFSQKTLFYNFLFQRFPILQPVFHQNSLRLIFVLFSMTNGLNGSFSSEHGVFADVAVLKHFSKKSKL